MRRLMCLCSLNSLVPSICRCSDELADSLDKIAGTSKPVDLWHELGRMALDMIGATVLGCGDTHETVPGTSEQHPAARCDVPGCCNVSATRVRDMMPDLAVDVRAEPGYCLKYIMFVSCTSYARLDRTSV